MNEILNWYKDHKKSVIILLVTVIIIFIFDIIFSNLPFINFPIFNYFSEFHNSYLQWIITNIFWALIVLFFLDIFIKEKEKKNELDNIKNQIFKIDKILSIYLNDYINYATLITNIDKDKEYILKKWFSFKNILWIFEENSFNIADSKPPYKYFFLTQKKILKIIQSSILNINFENEWINTLWKLFIEYYEFVEKFNPEDAIDNFYNDTIISDKKFKDYIKPFIDSYSENKESFIWNYNSLIPSERFRINIEDLDWINKEWSNSLIIFERLYRLINYNLEFIENYNEIVKNLKNKK